MNVESRFYNKFYKDPNGCWIWTRCTTGNGYGQFNIEGKHVYAHRASWILYNGEIPAGLFVCHKCDTPLCVNPNHLFLGTQKDNQQDMKHKKRSTHGEKNGMSKFCTEDIQKMRELYPATTQQKIADMYNTSQSVISNIVNYKRWKYV